MKIAVMQPYYFPYVGYFELISDVDKFVFFDSAQYIRRGWVNKNRIRSINDDLFLTVPVKHAPRSTPISDINVANGDWALQHCRSLVHTYGKKSKDHWLYELLIYCHEFYIFGDRRLMDFLDLTIRGTANYLGLEHKFQRSSHLNPISGTPSEQIIHFCQTLGADTYVNPSGGRAIYDERAFEKAGIELRFIEPTKYENKLSIIDLCIGDGLTCLPHASTFQSTVILAK